MRKITYKIVDFMKDFDPGTPIEEMMEDLSVHLVSREIQFTGIFIEMNSGVAYVWEDRPRSSV